MNPEERTVIQVKKSSRYLLRILAARLGVTMTDLVDKITKETCKKHNVEIPEDFTKIEG